MSSNKLRAYLFIHNNITANIRMLVIGGLGPKGGGELSQRINSDAKRRRSE